MMPSCDWTYEQPLPTGGTQRIPAKGTADNDRDLVAQVRQFRANLNISQDNLEIEVAEFIKQRSPQNNKYPGRTQPFNPPQRVTRPIRPLIERITDWIKLVGPKQPKLLLEEEATERASICARCPQNVKWKTGCLPCCDTIIQKGRHLRQRVDYPHADTLKACRLHDFYLPGAVFIDRDFLGNTHPEAPENIEVDGQVKACWMKTEARSTNG